MTTPNLTKLISCGMVLVALFSIPFLWVQSASAVEPECLNQDAYIKEQCGDPPNKSGLYMPGDVGQKANYQSLYIEYHACADKLRRQLTSQCSPRSAAQIECEKYDGKWVNGGCRSWCDDHPHETIPNAGGASCDGD
jgi:hypothetical protein